MSVNAGPIYFDRPTIVEHPRDGSSRYRYADDLFSVRYSDAEFAAGNRIVMPVKIGDELVRLIESDWHKLKHFENRKLYSVRPQAP